MQFSVFHKIAGAIIGRALLLTLLRCYLHVRGDAINFNRDSPTWRLGHRSLSAISFILRLEIPREFCHLSKNRDISVL